MFSDNCHIWKYFLNFTQGETPYPPGRHPFLGRYPLGRHPLGRHPLSADTSPLGRHPPSRHPPWADTPPQQMATTAEGTHPTGMHSCFNYFHFRDTKNYAEQTKLQLRIYNLQRKINLCYS